MPWDQSMVFNNLFSILFVFAHPPVLAHLPVLVYLLLLAQLPAALFSGYLLLLSLAAMYAAQRTEPECGEPETRLACLVPAHNEEQLLPALLESLIAQDYPRNLFTLHLIADNCEDATADIGRRYRARVHERVDPGQRGKGCALNWCLQRLEAAGEVPQAYLFVDADSLVAPDFLRVMEAHYRRGERLIQSYYAVSNPQATWNTGLRQAALAVLHYLRPLGRSALGFSVGLKGNGMLVDAGLAHSHPWSASVTEDIEYHMTMLLDGERVSFAPGAVVWGEMPETFDQSRSQLDRWEQGRLEMARRYIPQLLKKALTKIQRGEWQSAFVLLDAVMEHLIPPFSILAGLTLGLLAAGLGYLVYVMFATAGSMPARAAVSMVALGTASLCSQVLYLLAGLRLVRAPAGVYRSFLYTPVFLFKKAGQILGILRKPAPQEWVKTRRNAQVHSSQSAPE